MTKTQTDGGPAYPCKTFTQNGTPSGESMGMSLRDYFAGQALAGWLASFGEDAVHPCTATCEMSLAKLSYQMADAMLAAREADHDQ